MAYIVKISEFPYGKISANLRKAAEWLNKNQKTIEKEAQKLGKDCFDFFDFPDYWDLPKKIANKLYPDEVDFIQDQTQVFAIKTMRKLNKEKNNG